MPMAVLMALLQSICAWQHQQMDWQRACRPSCMPMGMAMAQLQTVLTLGWAVIWDQRLQVSSQGHYLSVHSQGLAYRFLHISLDLHASYCCGPQLLSGASAIPDDG